MRATVFTSENTTLDEAAIKTQLEEKGLELVSFDSGVISKPVAAYTINLKGTG